MLPGLSTTVCVNRMLMPYPSSTKRQPCQAGVRHRDCCVGLRTSLGDLEKVSLLSAFAGCLFAPLLNEEGKELCGC